MSSSNSPEHVSIHVNHKATPVVVHVQAPIPLHWQDQVEQDLKRDEFLGVIENFPHGKHQYGVIAWL